MFGGRYNKQARGNSKRPSNAPNHQKQNNPTINVKSGEVDISVNGVMKPRRTMLQSLKDPIDAQIIKNILQFNVIEQRINQSQAQEIKVLNLAMQNPTMIANMPQPGAPNTLVHTPPKRLDGLNSGEKVIKGFSSPYSPIPEEQLSYRYSSRIPI